MQTDLPKIVSLDIATKTGWAVGYGDPDNTEYGTKDFSESSNYLGQLGDLFSNWLADLIHDYEPDIFVIEVPVTIRSMTARRLTGMCFMAETIAYRLELPYREYRPTEIKKYWADNGRADKKQMMAAAKLRGFKPEDDNQADAIALLNLCRDDFVAAKEEAIKLAKIHYKPKNP